jgi:sterol desaturase/sphingolipid hydroxylase (fatty acid hydroxylase superfamily)
MLETLGAWLAPPAGLLAWSLAQVLVYPVDPGERIFWAYLLSSLALAAAVWAASLRSGSARPGPRGFLHFCFPPEVWRHPSAWLDVRYFFLHQMLRVWIYGGLATSLAVASADAVATALRVPFGDAASAAQPTGLASRAAITLFAIAAVDFAGFLAHWAQHKSPLLWAFHKVHHSARVMHPLSNYREHWVDNLLYALVHGVTSGAATSLAAALLGQTVAPLEVLGVNVFVFAFNAAGYNLRHSHVWLAWPGWLGWVLGSPAYHQIHHSVDPRHLDRNFAFMFPVWDRLFGCAWIPREREELRFGLAGGGEDEYRSVLRLWFLPFTEILRRELSSAATPGDPACAAGAPPSHSSPPRPSSQDVRRAS